MGWWTKLMGEGAAHGYQLLLRDDGGFGLKQRLIEDEALIEKDSAGRHKRAWYLTHKLVKPIVGAPGVKHGFGTVSYERDIIYDIFDELAPAEKPQQGPQLIKAFVRERAEAKCYAHEKRPVQSLLVNRAVTFMGVVSILLGLALLWAKVGPG